MSSRIPLTEETPPSHAEGTSTKRKGSSSSGSGFVFPTDDTVNAIRAIVEEVKGVVSGEFVDVVVKNDKGAVTLSGSTSSLGLFKRVEERVPRMKAVEGVKSVDISAIQHPGW